MENKYYTPAIEDLHVGYECEFHGMTVGGLFFFDSPEKNVEPHIPVWYPWIIGTDVWTTRSMQDTIDALERGQIRTPYLTKEQIEKEGWKLDYSREVTPGIIYHNGENTLWVVDNKEDSVFIWIRDFKDNTLYKGRCPSINELRKLTKLLNIPKCQNQEPEPKNMSAP